MIQTAKDFLIEKKIATPKGEKFRLNLSRDCYNQSEKDIQNAMIEFAKLHVQEALKKAYLKAELKEGSMDEEGRQICHMGDDMGDSWILDKESILNAYNLDLIK